MAEDEAGWPEDMLQGVARIQDALAPYAKTPEDLEQMTRMALKKAIDPVGYEQESAWVDQEHARLQAELAQRKEVRRQKIEKLRAAYHNFEKLPHSPEKVNYQIALRSMLGRFGAKP
jgi:hypothetical protein